MLINVGEGGRGIQPPQVGQKSVSLGQISERTVSNNHNNNNNSIIYSRRR